MGDYGFGVLVQNNTGNKSAFPVRFHPHLQPPHHHQNATPSPAAFINNNTAAGGSNAGSAWLFPAPAAHNIQDEILGSEKSKTQQQQQDQQDPLEKQQLSPSQGQESGMLPESEKAKSEENQGDNSSENGNGKEKIRIESPVLTGFDYQEASGLGTSTQPLTSSASSLTGFSNWSAAIAPSSSTIINEDASFFHQGGVPAASANNGALLFQNFPHHVSPGFGGSFSPQIGPLSQHHPHHPHFQHHHNQHQQQRRSPASPHPPPFTHRNAAFNQLPHLANNLNKPPSPWSSYQSPSPTPSSSWSPGGGGYGGWGGSQGRDHRRGLNGGITPLNSISPLKKNFASNHIQLQKYARPSSAFAPKSWMEDSLNRADNIFPFQWAYPAPFFSELLAATLSENCYLNCRATEAFEAVRSQDRTRTFDMHSLESSLIDIMRAENDSLKGRLNYSYPGSDSSLLINARTYGAKARSVFTVPNGRWILG
uniref:Cytoplasmic polyadenylation element binding protein 4 n=1 Tax=Ornithorhynchus anatinus TaxID=9258 RepID=A0A6I8N3A3_ORNAN